ncbi:DUF4129 domain-containing protein [Gemmata sp. JC673]|uniref:DUF4129 domain-containing protein n=1 Tax=Gemmata algarum TaxID=2975278 RepID=A0ABU5F2A2_9BACT|nr:DUF4129 domain-containing protein [Gemmata algarum]MDY3561712.1 DUF4129 domain-containing protein [Gemmata algarum]
MASEREAPSAVDYVVIALSPALVMLMVGSLVFFLVEVLYAGQYSGRLLYTMFFFVFGAVLVARISIQYDAARASLYGAGLAIATYLALLAYVEYPAGWLRAWGWLVNLGLLVLIWWSAHKLTRDCTHLDEKDNSSGRGLLSAAGLDADEPAPGADGAHAPPEPAKPVRARKKKGKKKTAHDSKLWDWIERYKAHREAERKKGHTPGVWVLYFALAALPLFALGQSLVGPDDAARRRATFLQMAVYIGSALGLLVTTSLLGVRRYLRQRKAKVPVPMTVSWLVFGGVLIAAFLVLGAFLPRPHSEVPWFGIERAGKAQRNASRNAQLGDASGQGDGRGGNKAKAGNGSASGKGGQPGGGTKGEKGSGGKGSEGKGGSGKKGDQSGGEQKGNGKGQGGENEGRKDNENDQPGGDPDREGEDAKSDGGRKSGSPSDSQMSETLAKIAGVVKWIVFAIIAILIVFGLFFGVLKYLAPFTEWARRWLEGIRSWWQSLFGARTRREGGAAVGETKPPGPQRPPPFSAYSNPFADGTSEERDPAELIAYTFEAFDAWVWDHGSGRDPAETPLEFARRVGEAFPDHAEAFAKLSNVYTRTAYSELPIPENALAVLEDVWERLVHGAGVEV